ncbi:MAG: serine hydrolase domain-containing protein, partial [Bacillota bacterium]|nr:serine hydrolase domain-containing protein [Bacillota bacterium]
MKSLTPSSIRKMERAIEQHMYFNDIPGLAVCLLADNELVYVNGFGMADLSANKKMTSGAIFHMASISKLFTATAVMQLHEQGKLDIDTPVLHYLKDFIPSSSTFSRITIRQMLSHTSGIPDCEDYEWESPRYDDQALHDYVMAQNEMHLLSEPGKRFFYSNIAYEMLGVVIQIQAGLTFEDYCKKFLFLPMGMLQSDFLKSRISSNKLAQPHIKDR